MALQELRDRFRNSTLGKAAMAGALALPISLASLGPAANNAFAGEMQSASAPTAPQAEITKEQARRPSHMMHEMQDYSEDPNIRGIGVFINLRKDSSVSGDEIGQWIQKQFAAVGVPVKYWANQSNGTATDITMSTKGHPFTMNVAELEDKLPIIYAHHQDVWTPQTTAALTQQ